MVNKLIKLFPIKQIGDVGSTLTMYVLFVLVKYNSKFIQAQIHQNWTIGDRKKTR